MKGDRQDPGAAEEDRAEEQEEASSGQERPGGRAGRRGATSRGESELAPVPAPRATTALVEDERGAHGSPHVEIVVAEERTGPLTVAEVEADPDVLTIAGQSFRSRLLVGTGKYASQELMAQAIRASGAQMVTVAVRRVDLDRTREEGILYHLDGQDFFLLANTADFDPGRHALAVTDWIEIDRYAVALAARLQEAVIAEYDRYEFHTIAARLQAFCSEELGAFYLDILKDRLYTCGADSRARRSAQNALHHLTQSLVRLMAPILSFTAEEVWNHAGAGSESVFLHTWYELPAVPDAQALLARWDLIRQAKGEVQKELEALRVAGKIGSSLQAEVEVCAAGEKHDALAGLGDDLRFAFITSRATLRKVASEAEAKVLAMPSPHAKCERCWHYRADVGANPEHPTLCERCDDNLHGAGEARRHA